MILELVERMLAGDQVALAKLISKAENRSAEVPEIMARVQPHTGRAYRIGITGPPGAGKSTMVDQLTRALRARDATVGIVAVDPTSPFSGGALLGDRIRMQRHYVDKGVFIRSMGTRGNYGGLARATKDVVKLLDAAGKDYVLVETVGVGQTELNIAGACDTVIVLLVPEAGDAVQTMKAGVMEIADIFVVNKADRGGAERLRSDIEAMLHMNSAQNEHWQIPALLAEAHNGQGIDDILEAIEKHREMLERTGGLAKRREEHRTAELLEVLEEQIRERLMNNTANKYDLFNEYSEKVRLGELDPYSAALAILNSKRLLSELLKS